MVIPFLLALVSLGLGLWQWLVARRFPLHQRIADPSFTPSLSVLKPLKGVECQTEECLRSWLEQQYSGLAQVLFGVASADDPVCPIVRRLIETHPTVDAELVICGQSLGTNVKVSTLAQLQDRVKHDLVVISDADVSAPPDFLANAVSALHNPQVGLVTCFYRLANPTTLPMRWEAVAINSDFWSQVLQARSLKPLDFALGAVMITRRRELMRIGGFSTLLDYLADDYQLANRIARQRLKIHLCPVVVDCWAAPMNWAAVWAHQLRWARTIRISKPAPYFFSLLSNQTLWPAILLLSNPEFWSVAFAAFCWSVRAWSARDQLRRFEQRTPPTTTIMMFWLKDLLQAAIWAASFSGNKITWRGQRFRVLPSGRLISLSRAESNR